ncbi:MAG: GNAT family N-acetyltransferase [Xanthomonadales bacterium]
MAIEPRIIPSLSAVAPEDWARLEHRDNPFVSYAFLAGLESTGSIGPHAGWSPHHLALYANDRLVAFAPTYAKNNSHGEFVFDWAWADAYQRNGYAYYPKLLTGVPYSPVTGPRLMVARDHPDPKALRRALVDLAMRECNDHGFSSWHCNFVEREDLDILAERGLLQRHDWQFHWRNRGYGAFDDFLADLRSRKRKNIRRERAQLQRSGVTVRWRSGRELDADDLDFVYACYIDTFQQYGNYPALRPAFFALLARELADGLQVAFAERNGQRIAMAVFLAGGGRLYGRYWGCTEDLPGLHFEVAYYQGIEFCIRHGIDVFESGAQGEHKIGRGFLPSATRSCHFVAHDGFRAAIAAHLEREHEWMAEYRERAQEMSPFRRDLE